MEAQGFNHNIIQNSCGFSETITMQRELTLFIKLTNLKEFYYENIDKVAFNHSLKTVSAFREDKLIFACRYKDLLFVTYAQKKTL